MYSKINIRVALVGSRPSSCQRGSHLLVIVRPLVNIEFDWHVIDYLSRDSCGARVNNKKKKLNKAFPPSKQVQHYY